MAQLPWVSSRASWATCTFNRLAMIKRLPFSGFRGLCQLALIGILIVSGSLSSFAAAETACRLAFDFGSSGIRAGGNFTPQTARVDIDFLAPLRAGRTLSDTQADTLQALSGLAKEIDSPPNCPAIAGGMSAWRLAAERHPEALAELLRHLHAQSQVAVFVIPQTDEGHYGFVGAEQALGDALKTTHIVDIGGGSLQVASRWGSFGDALGQKAWHQLLCQALRQTDTVPCALQPMTAEELSQARALLANRLLPLKGMITTANGPASSLTAISRPVTHGIAPALAEHAHQNHQTQTRISLSELQSVIQEIAPYSVAKSSALLHAALPRSAFLFSDMLLLEGVLLASELNEIQLASVDLTNLPGLLLDDRAYRWASHYDCYLTRLVAEGVEAYRSEPSTCPAPAHR